MFVRVTVVEVEKEAAHVFVVDFPSAVGFILRDNLQTPTSNILNVYISNPLFSSGETFMYKNHYIHSFITFPTAGCFKKSCSKIFSAFISCVI